MCHEKGCKSITTLHLLQLLYSHSATPSLPSSQSRDAQEEGHSHCRRNSLEIGRLAGQEQKATWLKSRHHQVTQLGSAMMSCLKLPSRLRRFAASRAKASSKASAKKQCGVTLLLHIRGTFSCQGERIVLMLLMTSDACESTPGQEESAALAGSAGTPVGTAGGVQEPAAEPPS